MNIIEKIGTFFIETIRTFFENRRDRREIKYLCEKNPQGLPEWINTRFGLNHTIDYLIKQLGNMEKEMNVNEIIESLANDPRTSPQELAKLIKYAIENEKNVDINILKNNPSLLEDYKIAEYVYSQGGMDTYDFCKLHTPNNLKDMEKFVKEDIRCIEFDYTNDPKLYDYVINEFMKKVANDKEMSTGYIANKYSELSESLKKAKDVILYRRKKDDGKYYLPETEMFENIRDFAQKYSKLEGKDADFEDVRNLEKPFSCFYQCDGYFDKEFGEKMKKMYFDESTIIGVHNTAMDDSSTEEELEKYFEDGLTSLADSSTIELNVRIQENRQGKQASLAEIITWVWDMGGKYNLIFQFPRLKVMAEDGKSRSPLIENSIHGYRINPKYIAGAYERENPKATLIKNDGFSWEQDLDEQEKS